MDNLNGPIIFLDVNTNIIISYHFRFTFENKITTSLDFLSKNCSLLKQKEFRDFYYFSDKSSSSYQIFEMTHLSNIENQPNERNQI